MTQHSLIASPTGEGASGIYSTQGFSKILQNSMYEACTRMRSFQTQTQLDTHFLSSLAVLHWTDVGQEYGDAVAVPCPVIYMYSANVPVRVLYGNCWVRLRARAT